MNLDRSRVGQEAKEVYEVANLAQDAASALFGIVDPMVGGDVSGVDAVVDGEGFVDFAQEMS